MGLWMKKALNFDLNTKKYEEYTGNMLRLLIMR